MQAPLDLTSLPTELELQQWNEALKVKIRQRARTAIKEKWANNPIHASYFCGKTVLVAFTNSAGQKELQIKQITIDELVANFKAVLAEYVTDITNIMWNNSPVLMLYFSGQPTVVVFINEAGVIETGIRQISFEALIANLDAALAGHRTEISTLIWKANPILASYYSGMATTIPVFNSITKQNEPRLRLISFNELMANFKKALASRNSLIIKDMWDNNSILASYFRDFSITTLSLKDNGVVDVQVRHISIEELSDSFKTVIAGRCAKTTCQIWDANLSLRMYFSGMAIMVPVVHAITRQYVLQETRTDINSLVGNFKAALSSYSNIIIEYMCKYNPTFISYFSGLTVELPIFNPETKLTESTRIQISMDDLLINFKAAISSRKVSVINLMWNKNPVLSSYYSGMPTTISVYNSISKQTEYQLRQISGAELLDNFKVFLTIRCMDLVTAIWNAPDSPLKNEIHKMQDAPLKALIEHVLSSEKSGSSEFIKTFLNAITKTEVLEAIVREKSGRRSTACAANQINHLTARINSIKNPQVTSVVVYPGMFRIGANLSNNNKRFKPNDTDESNSPTP